MENLQRPEYAHAKALRRTRYMAVFAVLAAAFLTMIILNINTGSVSIPVDRILRILFLRTGEAREVSIIWKIRMPRILQAAILGGALALSG
jgi:iron complex transport system permease protein